MKCGQNSLLAYGRSEEHLRNLLTEILTLIKDEELDAEKNLVLTREFDRYAQAIQGEIQQIISF